MKGICTWLVAAAALAGTALPQEPRRVATDKRIKELAREYGAKYQRESGIPGLAMGILFDGREFYYEYGHADVASEAPVTHHTLFGIGEVTEVFNGVLLAHLAQDGTVKLSDPVANYLPAAIKPSGEPIAFVTLEDLATHTSQLKKAPAGAMCAAYAGEPPSQRLQDFWLEWRPEKLGARVFRYSPGAATTLVHAIGAAEPAGGYNGALERLVTGPLGMDRTFTFANVPDELRASLSQGYDAPLSRQPPAARTPNWVDCGIVSTTHDMLAFLEACIGEARVVGSLRAALDLSMEPHYVINANKQDHMGLCWRFEEDRLGRRYTHSGRTSLYASFVGMIPEREVAVVLLSNGTIAKGAKVRPFAGTGRALLNELARYSAEQE